MSRKPERTPQKRNVPAKQPEVPEELRAEIERELGPLIAQGQREQVILRMSRIVMSEQFSGPIAHPRHLREYEDILPGSAERIVAMAESAIDHNRKMEERVVGASIWSNKAGTILGSLALLILISAAVYAGMNGNNILAGLLLGTGVLGGAATLIRGYNNGSQA